MAIEFRPNVDLSKVFNSSIMLINDEPGAENGQILIKAGADGPPIHTHPEQEEKFTVIRGQLEVYHQGKWRTLKEGDSIFTPKQMAHSYRSRHQQDCLFEYHLTPQRNFSGMLKTFEKLTAEQKLKSTSGLRSMIYLALTFNKYSSEIKSVEPPQWVITTMAGIGKRLGFKI